MSHRLPRPLGQFFTLPVFGPKHSILLWRVSDAYAQRSQEGAIHTSPRDSRKAVRTDECEDEPWRSNESARLAIPRSPWLHLLLSSSARRSDKAPELRARERAIDLRLQLTAPASPSAESGDRGLPRPGTCSRKSSLRYFGLGPNQTADCRHQDRANHTEDAEAG